MTLGNRTANFSSCSGSRRQVRLRTGGYSTLCDGAELSVANTIEGCRRAVFLGTGDETLWGARWGRNR